MAPPDGHSGPGKWSLPTPPDVSSLDPTLIHLDPPFRSLQGCLWLGVPFMALFGQFLAIKWVKMAGSKMAVFGSRPSSTQWTRYMYWFSRNDNFEFPPPLNTLCCIRTYSSAYRCKQASIKSTCQIVLAPIFAVAAAAAADVDM